MNDKKAIDLVQAALGDHASPTRAWLVGAPWFATPPVILEGLQEAGNTTSFPYPPPQGLKELRQAVCRLHRRSGTVVTPDQIAVTHGAKGGLTAILGCLLQPGADVLVPTPSYPAYAAIARNLGATPIPIPQEGDSFSLTTEVLEKHLTPQTRAIVLSSPCNPTGAILDDEQAELTIAFCRRHGLRLICDEAYAAFTPKDRKGAGVGFFDPELATTIRVRSFSKSFAVCGWRIGYVVTDATFALDVGRWQSTMLNPPNWVAQKALINAPLVPPGDLDRNRHLVRARLEALAAAISDIGLPAKPPQGGFYLWIDVRALMRAHSIDSSLDLCCRLAQRSGIGLWPGEDYGSPGYVRISVVGCRDEEWDDEVSRLLSGLAALQTI